MELPVSFVISPNALMDRRRSTLEHLCSVGLRPKVFPGLYGEDVGLVPVHPVMTMGNSMLTKGQTSLALNHWFLWQHIVLAEIPIAIIFEDDIVLPDDFRRQFDNLMSRVPDDWEWFYLSMTFPDRMMDDRIVVNEICPDVWQHRECRTWDGAIDGSYAYMLKLSAAQKIAGMKFLLDEPIDRWISFNILPLVKTYIWHPSPIKQRSGIGGWKSSI